MPRSKSSARWLQEHFCDFYVKKAQQDNYRSRAVYKLQEIDEKERLIKPGMTIIDLGAAPGGWSQYISRKLNGQGLIFALDILPMDTIADVHCIQGDFYEASTIDKINQLLKKNRVDLLLSDMAPNSSGNPAIDIPKAMHLAELALDFAHLVLKPGGSMVMKLFHGSGFEALIKSARSCFQQVVIRKPKASRARSRETYLLAKQYKKSYL